MAIERTGVVGCGAMGTGIAQLCAAAGYDVVVVDADEAQLERGLARIKSGLEREAERERLTQEQLDRAIAGLTGSQRLSDVADLDIVVEAIIEEIGAKRELFAQLGEVCSGDTVLASNTSSLSISELAAASGRPGSVVGLHFFNPPTVLRLVELTTTVSSTPEAVERAAEFCDGIDRVTIRASDTPGFVVNRIFVPFVFDAIRMLESNVASAQDIDQGCQLGLSHRMGPLATADLIGLDTLAAVGDALFEAMGETRFKTPTLLSRLVSLGKLGRKSGSGFFDYE